MSEHFTYEEQFKGPEKIVQAAQQAARDHIAADDSEETSRRYWWGRVHPEYAQRLLFEQRTADAIVARACDATTPVELADAIEALRLWLPQCDDGQEMRTEYSGVPEIYRVGVSEARKLLFRKIITSGWVRNYEGLDRITDALVPLLRPQEAKNGAAKVFARGTPMFCDNLLEDIGDHAPDVAADTVWLLAALTDKAGMEETAWGKIGIQRFNPGTSFCVTEEVWRRFVLEHRDIYAPVNEQAHMDTLAKYCYTLIKRTVDDPQRNPKSAGLIRRFLKLDTRGLIEKPLKPVVTLANLATEQANQFGGFPDADGIIRPHEPLTTASRLGVGEALRRILLPTHSSDPALRRQQLYTDSVHVEIIHELSALGADIRKTLDRGDREDGASG